MAGCMQMGAALKPAQGPAALPQLTVMALVEGMQAVAQEAVLCATARSMAAPLRQYPGALGAPVTTMVTLGALAEALWCCLQATSA